METTIMGSYRVEGFKVLGFLGCRVYVGVILGEWKRQWKLL